MKICYLKQGSKKGFSLLAGINRPIVPSHVTKLASSIELMGIIRPVVVAKIPFIGNDVYIIDGQHLYMACIRLGVEIPYVFIEVQDKLHLIEQIAKLNASSKNWILDDYITAWSSINEDYKVLGETKKIYDMEVSYIASIFMERTNSSSGGYITNIIKRGEFKIMDHIRGIQTLDICTEVLGILPRMDRYANRTFLSTFLDKYRAWGKVYNHKVFIEFLKKNKNKLILATQDPHEIAKVLEKSFK